MSLLQQAPRFDAGAAVTLARQMYGIDATAAELPSERDQNFLLTTADGRFVLKIANASEKRALLEAQNAALDHLANLRVCPRVVAAPDGRTIVDGPDNHLIRLLTWLPGVPLVTVANQSDDLLADLGRRLGEIDRTLRTFDHPAIHRSFHWDLARAFEVVREHSQQIEDPGFRGLVERVASRVAARDLGALGRARRSVIHGDPNDYNVLVEDDVRVSGVIDFGDCVYSLTVADLAIAIAYAVLDKADPLATAETIVRGYHAAHPLTDDEIGALFGLVQLRQCVSVCMAAHQQPERPGDAYLGVSQAPIRATLPRLAAIHPDAAEDRFREACGREPLFADRRRFSKETTARRRRQLIGRNVSVAYREPLKVSRGWMQYLFDDEDRQYLDGYNNVPHVGHSHPRVAQAASIALRTLNTNTRYLHDSLWRLADRLTATLPDPLRVCYFVNSGSEANELALRLAHAYTRQRDVIVLDAAYHGNTTALIDISPYKFNGPGGEGAHPWVHVAPIPDDYRGRYKRTDPEAGPRYAEEVGGLVAELRRRYVGLSAFIAETCPSVAGQIVPPPGYFQAVYRHVREMGGVCIADEVQTAYGRMGSSFYAFQAHSVVPDIVVLGKPIGNGYPLGAVVTTREIAGSFHNGMEFFSTFGGSTASCAVGLAVLDVLAEERLQAHAQRVGDRLIGELRSLQTRHEMIGDVRGSGFFIGVELVRSHDTLEAAADAASFVVNHMRDRGVLIGTDGPLHNVLKIRPPMPFDDGDVDRLISTLDAALSRVAGNH